MREGRSSSVVLHLPAQSWLRTERCGRHCTFGPLLYVFVQTLVPSLRPCYNFVHNLHRPLQPVNIVGQLLFSTAAPPRPPVKNKICSGCLGKRTRGRHPDAQISLSGSIESLRRGWSKEPWPHTPWMTTAMVWPIRAVSPTGVRERLHERAGKNTLSHVFSWVV